ncbi:MAG: right-handed parallel beta-helix repeat-containing protein [Draconibacterium sp.]|nr:right-handed parallel beta-helix repeat-containing protein [Draconibacterium sp.]
MKLISILVSPLFFLVLNVTGVSSQIKTEVNKIEKSDTTTIYLKDFGLEKTRKRDCVKIIKKALESIQGTSPKKLIFPRGEYHFYPEHTQRKYYYESNTTDENPKKCAFLFEQVKNLVIDGNGSRLIFHEQMQPFTFDNCENVTLKNVNIDWDHPLTAQGEVLKVTDEYIELGINLKEFPYRVEEGKLFFTHGKWGKEQWKGTIEFDRKGRFVVPQTGDLACLGRGWENYLTENIIPGIVRLYYPFLRKPALGNFLIMRHAERIHSGIFIYESKNITIENVNLYHATGLGILAQFSEDLTFNSYRAIPNLKKNRYFGGGDDGLQVSNCKGSVTVTNCEFAGLMDDPINVHGTSVRVEEIISETQLRCKFMHQQSVGLNWGHPGDKISFIENTAMNSIAIGEVENFKSLDLENFIITFKKPVPKELKIEDALENLTWSPNFYVANSHFKSCRARGILVSTPGKVVIENNIFESSGSAILIAGDANGWFESGAVNDVLIKNNIFTELCNSSSYQFCEGIISIFPIIPKLDLNIPRFHKNIKIVGNEFHPFDYPVLFAKSVDKIVFENNTIARSFAFEPYHHRKYTFSFEACKNISIANNTFSDGVLGKNILLKWTDKKELNCNPKQNLKIEMAK